MGAHKARQGWGGTCQCPWKCWNVFFLLQKLLLIHCICMLFSKYVVSFWELCPQTHSGAPPLDAAGDIRPPDNLIILSIPLVCPSLENSCGRPWPWPGWPSERTKHMWPSCCFNFIYWKWISMLLLEVQKKCHLSLDRWHFFCTSSDNICLCTLHTTYCIT